MKKLISNYSFNAASKTVTFSDYGSISLENVLLVTNVTSNTIIYNFAQASKGGTVSGNVLTLTYNTTSMSNGDKLQIYYDDPAASNNLATGAATAANQTNGNQQVQGNVASATADAGNPVKVGGVYSNPLPTLTTGQRGDLQLDNRGNLAVNAKFGAATGADGVSNNSLTSPLSNSTATPSGGSTPLQIAPVTYNGTTWDRIRQATSASGTTGTGLLGAGILGFDGTNYQRIKTDTNGVIATSQSDGTTVGNNITGDAGQNAQLVAGNRKEVSFSTTSVANVASTDASNYRWVSVHVLTQGTSSLITFQGSNDNTNWVNFALAWHGGTIQAPVTFTTAAGVVYHGPLPTRYFRIAISGISAGTTSGVIEFSSLPTALNNSGVTAAQAGTWTVGSSSATGSAPPTTAFYSGMSDGTNLIGLRSVTGAGDGTTGVLATASYVYNGTNFDKPRSATTAAGTIGTGLLGAGVLGFDGTNYQRLKTDSSGVLAVSGAGSGGDVITGDTGQNALLTAGGRKELTGLSAGSLNADLLPSTDVSNYAWGSVQVTGTWSGTITFQVSNDNSNWNSMTWASSGNTTNSSSSATTGNATYHGPISGRYIRIRMTTYASGTANGIVELFNNSRVLNSMGVAAGQSGTWTVGSNSATGVGVPANAFYMGIINSGGSLSGIATPARTADNGPGDSTITVTPLIYNGSTYDRARAVNSSAGTTGTGLPAAGVLGIYNASAPTVTSGNFERLQLDTNANLKSTLATQLAGEDLAANRLMVEQRNSYNNVTTNTTTTVKSGAGLLHAIVVNNPSAITTTPLTLTIYDNTSAAAPTVATTTVPLNTTAAPFTVNYDITFSTGLTIVTAGPAVAADLTVVYR
jgi:hypothetical protein